MTDPAERTTYILSLGRDEQHCNASGNVLYPSPERSFMVFFWLALSVGQSISIQAAGRLTEKVIERPIISVLCIIKHHPRTDSNLLITA